MTVSPTSLSMNFGQFAQLTPTILDGNGTDRVSTAPNVQATLPPRITRQGTMPLGFRRLYQGV